MDVSKWVVATAAWEDFVKFHPELGYSDRKWAFHNFMRHAKDKLIYCDAIRLAKNRYWIAHREKFISAAFDISTNVFTEEDK